MSNGRDERDDIRNLLHHAVSDVHPDQDVRGVLARAGEGSRRSVGWLAPIAAAAVVALALGGVGWLNRDTTPARPPASSATRTIDVTTYAVGDTAAGPRLFSERHSTMAAPGEEAQAAVSAALAGPSDSDYRSGLPSQITANVDVGTDTIVIDLHGSRLALPPPRASDALYPIYALAKTAQAAVDRPTKVEIKLNGAGFDELLGTKVTGSPYVVALPPDDELLSPVSINLDDDSVIKSGTAITGSAAAFEATVTWQLTDNGRVVRHGFATARECCTLSPYSFTLDAPPGRYLLTVSESDPSGGEGLPPSRDTKNVTIE